MRTLSRKLGPFYPIRFRAYNRGKRVWAVQWPTRDGRWFENRYTLTSGVECSTWAPSAKEADEAMRDFKFRRINAERGPA